MINIQQQFYMNKHTKYYQFSLIMAILWYYKTIIKYGVMKEIWKDIDGYNGMYQVSNKGRIRSWKRPPVGKLDEPVIRKPDPTYQGYHRIALSKNAKKKKFNIHRLVARAFIPNPENKPHVNHKDFDKSNNHVDNLEWVTQSENRIHALENGMVDTPKGESHYRSKLTKNDVLKIKRLCRDTDLTQGEIGDKFNIDRSHVSDIKRGERWGHVKL